MWRRIVDGRLANKVRVKNCRKVGKEKHSPGASQEQGGTDCFFRSGRMKRAGAFQVLSLIGNSACNKAFCVFSLVKCLHFSSKWCNYPGERATRRFALSEKSGEGFAEMCFHFTMKTLGKRRVRSPDRGALSFYFAPPLLERWQQNLQIKCWFKKKFFYARDNDRSVGEFCRTWAPREDKCRSMLEKCFSSHLAPPFHSASLHWHLRK